MPKKKPVQQVHDSQKPVEHKPKEVDIKGLIAFGLVFLIVALGAFYFFTSKSDEATYAPDNRSIVIGGARYEFRHDIDNFTKVETFPNDLHIVYSIPGGIDYYRLDWSSDCEATQTCGVIGIAAVDIVNRVGLAYALESGQNPDFVTVAGNNSIVIYTKKEAVVESNISKLKGVDIVLLTPGSTNDTKVSYYESDNKNTITIEGTDSDNFLRAIDMFTYLILVKFT